MTQKGEHTWDLVYHYHRCPKCGYIQESRNHYEYRLGKYIKELDCERCGCHYQVTSMTKPTFGPLFGEPQPTEITWR